MNRRIVLLIAAILAVAGAIFLLYRGYGWWEERQKRKELFVYLQSKSPVTRRMPADAVFYLNLFDFKRVHSSIENTPLYKLFTHWLDTGMSDQQRPNAILGGMLEKTILNVIGQEVGVAIVPGGGRKLDFLVVARIEPGSDFLLRLALASNRKIKRIEQGDDLFYSITTRNPQFPEIFVLVDDQLAYAAASMAQILKARTEGPGPDFLRKLAVEAIPEDTFLMMEAASPRCSLLVSGGGRDYRIRSDSEAPFISHLPKMTAPNDSVLFFQTNGAELVHQPAVSMILRLQATEPVSEILLNFADPGLAAHYEQMAVERLGPPSEIQPPPSSGKCYAFNDRTRLMLCAAGSNIVLASTETDTARATSILKNNSTRKMPLSVHVDFRPDQLSGYLQRVKTGDWSGFLTSRSLYALSCVKAVHGGIDDSADTIEIQLQ